MREKKQKKQQNDKGKPHDISAVKTEIFASHLTKITQIAFTEINKSNILQINK